MIPIDLRAVWDAVTYLRDEHDEIVAVQLPIDHWRSLLDHLQALQDRLAARERLARLRPTDPAPAAPDDPAAQ